MTDDRWIGSWTGKILEVTRASSTRAGNPNWHIHLEGHGWFTTKSNAQVGHLITHDIVGQTATLYCEHQKNPNNRRVHRLTCEMYPEIPGME